MQSRFASGPAVRGTVRKHAGGWGDGRTVYVSVYMVNARGEHFLNKVVERWVPGVGDVFPRRLGLDRKGAAVVPPEVRRDYAALLAGFAFCYCVYSADGRPAEQAKTARCTMAGVHSVNGGGAMEVDVKYTHVVRYRLRGDGSAVREYVGMDDPELLDVLATPVSAVGGVGTEEYQVSGVANTSLVSYRMHPSGQYYEYQGASDVWCCNQTLPYYVSARLDFMAHICEFQRRTVQRCFAEAQLVLVREDGKGEFPMQRRRLMMPSKPMRYWEKGVDTVLEPIIADDPSHPHHASLMAEEVPPHRAYSLRRVAVLGKRFGFLGRVKACTAPDCDIGECGERRKRRRISARADECDDSASACSAASTAGSPMSCGDGGSDKENTAPGDVDEVHIVWDGNDVVPEARAPCQGILKFRPPRWRAPCPIPAFEAMRCEDTALQFIVRPATTEVPVGTW